MSFQDDSMTIFFNHCNTHAAEFVAGANDDGLPIRLLLLTEKDTIRLKGTVLFLCVIMF